MVGVVVVVIMLNWFKIVYINVRHVFCISRYEENLNDSPESAHSKVNYSAALYLDEKGLDKSCMTTNYFF